MREYVEVFKSICKELEKEEVLQAFVVSLNHANEGFADEFILMTMDNIGDYLRDGVDVATGFDLSDTYLYFEGGKMKSTSDAVGHYYNNTSKAEMIKTAKRYILQNNEWFEFIGNCECLEPLFYELLVAEKIRNEEV